MSFLPIARGLGGLIPGADLFDLGTMLYDSFNDQPQLPPPSGGPVAVPTVQQTGVQPMNSCSHGGTYRVVTTYDAATGQAIKQSCMPKRRRRKRLATTSDIKDLAALKSVLGNGENFKMWIATRGK